MSSLSVSLPTRQVSGVSYMPNIKIYCFWTTGRDFF